MIRDHMASLGITEALRTTETGGIFAMEGGRPGRQRRPAGRHRRPARAGGRGAAPSTRRSRASCTPAATTCTWPRCSARPRCWRRGARTCPGATSSSSSRRRRRCAAPRRCSRAARSTAMEGARLVGFHVTSLLPCGLRGPARRHRHVRGELAAHHAERAGRARRHALRRRATSSGPRPSWSAGWARWPRDCATRGPTACAAPARSTPARRSTWCRRRPGSPARCAPSPRPSTRRHSSACRTCATSVGDDQGVHVELEVPEHTRAVVNDAERPRRRSRRRRAVVVGPDQVFRMPPVGAERRRERVPAPPARLLLLRRRRGGGRLERDAPQPHLPASRTSRCASGPTSSCAARWHWPRRERSGHNDRR